MASASSFILTLLHLAISYHYTMTYWIYITDTKQRLLAVRPYTYGGEYKYFTIWCLILQLVYFFWSCITDMVSASAPHSSVGRATVAFRDWFLAAIVFPIGSLVVITFWAIYSINRELIFPAALDEFFPAWLNHALHTFVLPLLLIDMLLVKHKYPSRISGILGAVAFSLCYLVWILYLGFAKDIWVYPFLKVLEGPYFILFFAVMTVVLVIFYIIGEKLSSVLGGSEKKVSTAKFD